MRFALALLSAIALIAPVSGCGGGDSTTTASGAEGFRVRASTTVPVASPRIDRREFAKLVNQICREGWKVIRENFIDYRSWREPPESKRERFEKTVQLSLMAGLDFHIFDPIQDLGSAPGESRQIEELLGAFQKPIEMAQQEYWGAHSLAEIPPHFTDYNRRTRRLGVEECAVNMANLEPISRNEA